MSVELSSYAVARAKRALIRTLKKIKGVRLRDFLNQGRIALGVYESGNFYNISIRLFYTNKPDSSNPENYSEITLVSEPIVKGDIKSARRKALRTFIFVLRDRETKKTLDDWLKSRLSILNEYKISRDNGRALLELQEGSYGSPSWISKNPKSIDYLADKALAKNDTVFKRKKWSVIVKDGVLYLKHVDRASSDDMTVAAVDIKTGETKLHDKTWCNNTKREKIAALLDTLRTQYDIKIADKRTMVSRFEGEAAPTVKPKEKREFKHEDVGSIIKEVSKGKKEKQVIKRAEKKPGSFKGKLEKSKTFFKPRAEVIAKEKKEKPMLQRREIEETEKAFGKETAKKVYGPDYVPPIAEAPKERLSAEVSGLVSRLREEGIKELTEDQIKAIESEYGEETVKRIIEEIK